MIGLIPASGKATRFGGLPKFALPCDFENNSILKRQVTLMKDFSDDIVVCTSSKWYELVKSFKLEVNLTIIEPSTMNYALLNMAKQFKSEKYLIGMADTYFKGENPYKKLSQSIIDNDLSVACWKIDKSLIGKVGQVQLVDNLILDLQDKIEWCTYPHMWGALGASKEFILNLDKFNTHIGIDMQEYLYNPSFNHYAFEVDGEYFDIGNISLYKNLLNSLEL